MLNKKKGVIAAIVIAVIALLAGGIALLTSSGSSNAANQVPVVSSVSASPTALPSVSISATPTPSVAPTPAPTVARTSQAQGSTKGGTLVSIIGTGFEKGSTVRFGTLVVKVINYFSATSIQVAAPAHAAGKVAVYVSNSAGWSKANSMAEFTFVAPAAPVVKPVAPVVAPKPSAPVYHQPTYTQPAPTYHQPAPAPAPVYHQPPAPKPAPAPVHTTAPAPSGGNNPPAWAQCGPGTAHPTCPTFG